ncbi:hypothetical protein GUJ93_ZPchr0121g58 [Zizania palustris]|uniref:Histone deacetylase domain-containing protein n=1 Tax=Zizania palustris TaxID=103762 RepID=A0A8J5VH40_ZIZPA|nr:hypothetical protein GUJ93_ZPchr0121g58 [Zizania palustris]
MAMDPSSAGAGGNSLTLGGGRRAEARVCYFYDPEGATTTTGRAPHEAAPREDDALAAGALRLLDRMQVFRPHPARDRDLCRFHADDYIAFLRAVTPETQHEHIRSLKRFNVGEDCPVFDGLYTYCQTYAGASSAAPSSSNHATTSPSTGRGACTTLRSARRPDSATSTTSSSPSSSSSSTKRLGCFNLSIKGHCECVKFMRSFNVPLLLLGGGGYTIRNVARCWCYETGVALGQEIEDKMPVSEYYEYFGPDYTIHVAPSNMENKNTHQQLQDIKCKLWTNLSKLQHAPSVQFQERAPETKLPEPDEDQEDPDERHDPDSDMELDYHKPLEDSARRSLIDGTQS